MTYLLELKDVKKDFSGVEVLKGVSMRFSAGEVHGLLGENGAGKSTLIKILTGIYHSSGGEILVDGKPMHHNLTPHEANAAGIGAVYQDAELAWSLSVAENLLLGSEAGFFMNRKAMEREAAEVLGRIGLDIDPARSAGSLTAAEMQMLTLATLFHKNYRLIILDEPTARLSGKESEILFDLIRTFREKGITVVYISHRLAEVKLLCDRATILRDGKVVRTLERDEIDEELVTRLMVNRAASDLAITNPGYMRSDVVLELDQVSTDALKPFSTKVYAGEILGVTGPVGGGMEQIPQCLAGLTKHSGSIHIDGVEVTLATPQDAINRGIALIPEDRRKQALFPELTLAENVAMPVLDRIRKAGFISTRAKMRVGAEVTERLGVHPASPGTKMRYFSGGNQQKAVVGKWLKRQQKIYVFVEPTSGVDVGAIKQIYEIILQIAADGGAVIVVSTVLKELLALTDRIMVIHNGEVWIEGPRGDFDMDSLLGHILGQRIEKAVEPAETGS